MKHELKRVLKYIGHRQGKGAMTGHYRREEGTVTDPHKQDEEAITYRHI